MKGIVAWFVNNPVAANLVMIVMLVGGGLTYSTVKMELFPEFALDMISVTVPFPGAAPEEVEQAICIRIEEEVHAIDGVKRVTSTAVEGYGAVTIQLQRGAEASTVMDMVKTRVNAISTFPELAEQPIIEEILMRKQVINVAISGHTDEGSLKRIGEQVRDELSAIDGISQVSLVSARPYEISIEVSESTLRRYGMTFDDLANAVRSSSLDLSAGTLKTSSGEVLLRAKGQAYEGEDFRDLVLLTNPDGSRILLGDIATIIDGFADTSQSAKFNGVPMVQAQVFSVGDENALTVAQKVRDYIEEAQPRMVEGISLTTYSDSSVLLQGRLSLLTKNGFQGLFLVFAVLALFLRFRLAFWITAGIPISFMGALWLMPSLGVSINMLSLFAFILVLGIVVDDAIVIGESIFTEQKKNPNQKDATIKGTNRVAIPVTFAVMTTVVAFAPMLDLPGLFGKFFGVFPLAVIPILLFSWAESKIILPAHLAHGGEWTTRLSKYPPFSWWVKFQSRCEFGLEFTASRIYQPFLDFCLRWRYLTHAVTISVLLLTIGLVSGGFVRFVDFPKISGDLVAAQLTMPLGTAPEVTEEAVARIEEAARILREQVREERSGEDVVRHYVTSTGEQPFKAQQQNGSAAAGSTTGTHLGEIIVELIPTEEREDLTTEELVERWRSLCGPIPGAVELVFTADVMGGGDSFSIQFAGNDVAELRAAADDLKGVLKGLPGVYDISDSFRGGKQEILLEILPSAEALGLTLADLARQVRQGFYGEEVQRIQRGRNDVKVMVRYPLEDRRALHTLEQMRIRTPQGSEVPFSQVAVASMGRGYASISRSDRNRVVTVSSDLNDQITTNGDVLSALEAGPLATIISRHPSVSWSVEGQSAELRQAMSTLARLAVVAMLVIYALMAIPFKSYIQPAIVMTAVPFGVIGAVLGHILMDHDLSVLSLVGIVALTGVVVNDSLVLVDYINHHRNQGGNLLDAIRNAGVQRFRPILLTSLTTFAGLTPLMFETSVQAQFLIPMAITLAYGVIFSTAITLVFVPAGYLILDDILRLLGLTKEPPISDREDELPANQSLELSS
ncbi:MAG: multidrug efflux pump subunit AcrB [Planctomycetota bacterium]|jgi:multidrug efflux pump subunit AcrB